mmetsp:Transcript_32027/g.61707  ORF Transcript_32027/g.61707 Transcript_32027/m.61707 type:complete len:321 (+) Transcript_32027:161-1123(+)
MMSPLCEVIRMRLLERIFSAHRCIDFQGCSLLTKQGAAGWASARGLASATANSSNSSVTLNMMRFDCPAKMNDPPLIILHGLFGSSSNFRSIAKKLSEQRSVYLPDLRNHGDSPWHADASPQAMANDVVKLMDNLELPRIALCGHSLGGKVAMLVALQHPERVARLCVVDIAPIKYTMEGNRSILEVLHAMSPESLSSRKAADAALIEASEKVSALKIQMVRQFLMQNLLVDQRRWRVNVEALLRDYPSMQDFIASPGSQADMPTFFIGGEKEGMLESSHFETCRRFFPNSKLHMMQTGHWVHAEQPAEFIRLLSDFCAE